MLNEKEVTDFLVQFEKRIVVLMLSNYTKQPAGQIDNEEYFEKTSSNNLGVTSLTNLKKVVLTRFDYTAFGTTELRTLSKDPYVKKMIKLIKQHSPSLEFESCHYNVAKYVIESCADIITNLSLKRMIWKMEKSRNNCLISKF